ncbi:uncharacterized loc101213712 isoform 1 [Stylonychia lemnae]|uniref:Uncharacterized loc101213712 isoform 1 n=1 Tax=Stylonychia lemnae TaxID=5949 RepID=A0A077ZZE6_STYLE|nr:uncharacterized loc101213712 isoform 1 [Stylonychia lemnae]|eukprot:CDW75295.1 uncharacterized loc101213712 isoform 1 [Stylonychia lemnae]
MLYSLLGILLLNLLKQAYSIVPNEEDYGYQNFFVSDYCLMKQSNIWQMITLCFSSGYLTFDIYICYAKIQDHSKMQTQTYLHHICGITGFIMAIFYGPGGALIISNVLLINEFSTFFLNYRQFLLAFKRNDTTLYQVNAIGFFFAFFFSRIVFNTFVGYWIIKAIQLSIKQYGEEKEELIHYTEDKDNDAKQGLLRKNSHGKKGNDLVDF